MLNRQMVAIAMLFCVLTGFGQEKAQSWQESYYRGKIAIHNREYEKAIGHFEKAAEQAAIVAGKVDTSFVVISYELAEAYSNTLEYDTAIDILNQAILTADQTEFRESLQTGLLYKKLGQVLYKLKNEYQQAEKATLTSLSIFKKTVGENSQLYLSSKIDLGLIEMYEGKFLQSEKLLLEVREKLKTNDDLYPSVMSVLALLYGYMGQFEKGLEIFPPLLDAMGENHPAYTSTLFNFAVYHEKSGNYGESEQLKRKVLEIEERTIGKNDPSYAQSLDGLAVTLMVLGRYPEAEKLLNQSLVILKNTVGVNHRFYATSLRNLSLAYQKDEKYEKAEEVLRQALQIYENETGKEHRNYSITLSALSQLFLKTGDYTKAIEIKKEVLAIQKKTLGENHPTYANSLASYAYLMQLNDENNEAQDSIEYYYKKSLSILDNSSYNNQFEKVAIKDHLVSYYNYIGKTEDAISIMIDNINFFENYIDSHFSALGEYERASLYNKHHHVFEEFHYSAFNEKHVITGNTNKNVEEHQFGSKKIKFTTRSREQKIETYSRLVKEGMNLQLQQKASLLYSSKKIKERILESGDRKMIDLYDEVEFLRQIRGQLENMENIDQAKLDSISTLLYQKDKQLTEYSSLYKQNKNKPTWNKVRDQLKRDQALVEIVRFREYDYKSANFTDNVQYGAYVITGKTYAKPETVLLFNGKFLENSGIKAYRNFIKYKKVDTKSYELFWQPIKDKLENVSKIYLSADGVYNEINLKTLYNNQTDKYLFEEVEVHLLTSGKDLLIEERPALANNYALLIGDVDFGDIAAESIDSSTLIAEATRADVYAPLPGTKKEVEKIGKLLQENEWRHKIITGENANEEFVKNMIKPKVLHIATHGFFQKDIEDEEISFTKNPLYRSGILLSGAINSLSNKHFINEEVNRGKEDGILTAYEAMNLNIDNTELVVLSACETGLGVIKNGEGVYGLQRALQIAGARSILMSLWKVDDETTQQLMVQFYRNWLGGMTKREAFNQAQMSLKKLHPEPYFWGAFVMIGE